MKNLTILYDATCGFCRLCREWLEKQPQYVKLSFLPRQAMPVVKRYASLNGKIGPDELVAVDDEDGVYRGDAAYLICLYALEEYREWSFRLADPSLRPLAKRFFRMVATTRYRISGWLSCDNRRLLEKEWTEQCKQKECAV